MYGIASYWVQTFFKQSSGALLLDVHFHNHSKPDNTFVTAISWTDPHEKKNYITVKVIIKLFVNYPTNNNYILKTLTYANNKIFLFCRLLISISYRQF